METTIDSTTAKPRLQPEKDWRPGLDFGISLFDTIAGATVDFAAATDWPTLEDYQNFLTRRGIGNRQGLPLLLVKNPAKRGRRRQAPMPYEQRIYELGELPTRTHNWHDFFNLMIWGTFPRSKAAINERQVFSPQEIPPQPPHPRTPEQNALTRFDEGGCIVVCEPEIHSRFAAEFSGYNQKPDTTLLHHPGVKVLVFGHAIYDCLLAGRADMGAQSLVLAMSEVPADVPAEFLRQVDDKASELLQNGCFRGHSPTWSIPVSALCP